METANRFFRCFDNPGALLSLIVAVLFSIGLVTVYSASAARAGHEHLRIEARAENQPEESLRFHHRADYLKKQVGWAVLGLIGAALLLRLPLEYYERYGWVFFAAGCVLLVLVMTPLGVRVNGARRWLNLGFGTLQPSEFAKLGLVVFMASYLAKQRETINDIRWDRGLFPSLVIVGLFSVLVLSGRDFGTTVLMGAVVASMWVLARVKIQYLLIPTLIAIPAGAYLILSESYRIERFISFSDPEKYYHLGGYQLSQSLLAVGSGGWLGNGVGLGLQKYHFLNEAHTDFIFAIFSEEFGFVGSLAVCFLFLALVMQGFRISFLAADYFSGLLAAGITMMFGYAAFMNFCVVLGMVPTKGLALPFFSYGGSSIVASLLGVGLLVAVANDAMKHRGSREVF
jgi:cell division protein FtsW